MKQYYIDDTIFKVPIYIEGELKELYFDRYELRFDEDTYRKQTFIPDVETLEIFKQQDLLDKDLDNAYDIVRPFLNQSIDYDYEVLEALDEIKLFMKFLEEELEWGCIL